MLWVEAPWGGEVAVTIEVPEKAMLLAFTDGLVERRGESIDVGLARLRDVLAHEDGTVEEIVDTAASRLIPAGSDDDVVIVGVRWKT